jgi:hypothetical protein
MELNKEEQAELDKLKEIAITVPVDEEGNTKTIEVWWAVSVLDWRNKLYRLHPAELVNGTRQSVYLCGVLLPWHYGKGRETTRIDCSWR